MYLNSRTVTASLILFSFILFCKGSENAGNGVKPDSVRADPAVAGLAAYLSGTELSAESESYRLLRQDPFYKKYSLSLDQLWQDVEQKNRNPIMEWKKNNFEAEPVKTAFYPFSGADFINLYTFYPNAERYIMMALEPRGKITDPAKISAGRRNNALASMQSLISEISARNYFTRVRMRRTLHSPDINGTLPVLMIFITRLGHTVLDYEHIFLADDGRIQKDPTEVKSAHKGKGVRIHFLDAESRQAKELIYLDLYINPDSFSQNTPEGKFLRSQGRLSVFLKSAEYILHQNRYSPFNQALVDAAQTITQDDSGIPYRYIEGKMKVSVYGKYTDRFYLKGTPAVRGQPDLRRKFQTGAKSLPFAFGYGVLHGSEKSNLLHAVKE